MSRLLLMAKGKDLFKELGETDIKGHVRRCEDRQKELCCWSVIVVESVFGF